MYFSPCGTRLVFARAHDAGRWHISILTTDGQRQPCILASSPVGFRLGFPSALHVTDGAGQVTLLLVHRAAGLPVFHLHASVFTGEGVLLAVHAPEEACYHAVAEGLILTLETTGTLLRVRALAASEAWQSVELPGLPAALRFGEISVQCGGSTAAVWRFTGSGSDVCLVDLNVGAVVHTFDPAIQPLPRSAHFSLGLRSVALNVSAEGSRVHTVSLWGAREGAYGLRICELASGPAPPGFDPSGRFLAVAQPAGGVSILNGATGDVLASWSSVWRNGAATHWRRAALPAAGVVCRWLGCLLLGGRIFCRGGGSPAAQDAQLPGVHAALDCVTLGVRRLQFERECAEAIHCLHGDFLPARHSKTPCRPEVHAAVHAPCAADQTC